MPVVSPRKAAFQRWGTTAPLYFEDKDEWLRQIAQALHDVQQGKLAKGEVTLTANVAATTLSDARIGPATAITFDPTTANAAAELASGNMYPSSRTNGSAIISHSNDASVDRTFFYKIA